MSSTEHFLTEKLNTSHAIPQLMNVLPLGLESLLQKSTQKGLEQKFMFPFRFWPVKLEEDPTMYERWQRKSMCFVLSANLLLLLLHQRLTPRLLFERFTGHKIIDEPQTDLFSITYYTKLNTIIFSDCSRNGTISTPT